MMSRHNKLMRLTAFLLSFLLLLPVIPVFAEPEQSIDPEGILFNYDIEYTVPSDLLIKYFENLVVPLNAVGKMQLKTIPPMPVAPWVNLLDGFYLEWSVVNPAQLASTGAIFDGSELIIPPTANAGSVALKATIYMSMPMGLPPMQRYSETYTFNITERIPQIRFINPTEDFALAVPYYENTFDKDYRVEVVDQHGVVIPGLTPVLVMAGVSNAHMNDYYNPTTNHLHLYGEPGYAGEIYLHAYIQEFGDPDLEPTLVPPDPEPVLSVDKTIVISREKDYPAYGILKGKEHIAIPRTGSVTEVYNYNIYSQYNVLLENAGELAHFYFPSNQPATIAVDDEDQTVEITVKNTAPHSYLMLRAQLVKEEVVEPSETAPEPEIPPLKELWFGWETSDVMYIYLDKTVYGTFDDANNVVILDTPIEATGDGPSDPEEPIEQAIYENLQYRVAAFYPDPEPEAVAPAVRDGSWSEGWRDYNPEDPPKFPGKMDVEFRYKNNYRWRPMIEVDMDIECRPKAYVPGAVTEYNFTVLKPSIAANPTSPLVGSSSSVTITYNELHPGFELVPADIEEDLYWYDSNHFPYIALKSMWYRIGETGEWQRYENPFTVTSSTIIFAKTVVFLDLVLDQLRGTTDLPQYFDYSGNYTSPLASVAINFQQPTTQAPTQPETQAPTQPETQGPTQPATTQTLAPVETTTVSVAPATVAIEEVTVPQGALEETTTVQASASDLVFYEVVTPLGDATLPETNELPISLLYGMGVILGGLGVYLVKRKED